MNIREIKALETEQTIKFKIIDDTYKRRGRKLVEGIICFKNDKYLTLQLKHYKESFTYIDFRDRISGVKLC